VQDRLILSPLWPVLSGQVFLAVNDAFEALSGSASAQSPNDIKAETKV
jgi:hypothetical protein